MKRLLAMLLLVLLICPMVFAETTVDTQTAISLTEHAEASNIHTVSKNTTIKVDKGYSGIVTVKDKTIKACKSSKSKIVSVKNNGSFKAVAEGNAKITITTSDKKKITVTVKVTDPYKPKSISFTVGKSATMVVGEKLQLQYKLKPDDAKTSVTYSSSKKAVANVNAKTGLVTAKKAGTAKITVTTTNKKKATITIKVVKNMATPSTKPTIAPTLKPTVNPTVAPTTKPTTTATAHPSAVVTSTPSAIATAVPTQAPGKTTYVLNTHTMKFHKPGCSSVDQIDFENRWDVAFSRDEVISKGYVPCKRCNP